MNKIQFEYFVEQLKKIPAFHDAKIFRYFDKKWRQYAKEEVVVDEALAKDLSALPKAKSLRLKSPSRIIFASEQGEVAISLNIGTKIREATVARHLVRLAECEKTAASLFHANHDELTGVLNRNGIKHRLKEIYLTRNLGKEKEDRLSSVSESQEVVIYSFDIDKFKSVNDVYGHPAGDVVLAAFAQRLDKFIVSIENNYAADFVFGRPGGEEFELIALGLLSLTEKRQLADELLNAIRNPPLPTTADIDQFGPKKIETLRRAEYAKYPTGIKASIGIAWSERLDSAKNADDMLKEVRRMADTALYRAKSDGRNCFRIYEDIKDKHGRVSNYFEDSEIVQVDIGSSVGVKPGEIYSVCFPPFTGEVDVQENQNSEKILGRYPVIDSGKIMILEVSSEFSTCIVLEKLNQKPFPQGARLSYVPMGSKIPVVDGIARQNTAVGDRIKFDSHIGKLLEQGRFGYMCRLSGKFKKEKDAEVKQPLDSMLSILALFFPDKTKFFKPYSGGLFAVVELNPMQSNQDRIDELAALHGKLKDLFIKLGMQVCLMEDLPPEVTIDSESLLFYCEAASRKNDKDNVYFFDGDSPGLVIHGWRRQNRYKDAIVDYGMFRSYGFSSVDLDNQIGLAIFESDAVDYFYFAEKAFLNASLLENHSIYKANLALIRTRLRKYAESYDGFLNISGEIEEIGEKYLFSYAKSAVEVCRAGNVLPTSGIGDVLLRTVEVMSKTAMDVQESLWFREIKESLASGMFD